MATEASRWALSEPWEKEISDLSQKTNISQWSQREREKQEQEFCDFV